MRPYEQFLTYINISWNNKKKAKYKDTKQKLINCIHTIFFLIDVPTIYTHQPFTCMIDKQKDCKSKDILNNYIGIIPQTKQMFLCIN